MVRNPFKKARKPTETSEKPSKIMNFIYGKIFRYLITYHKEDYIKLIEGPVFISTVIKDLKIKLINWLTEILETGFLICIVLLLFPIFKSNLIWYYKYLLAIFPIGISSCIIHNFIIFLFNKGK